MVAQPLSGNGWIAGNIESLEEATAAIRAEPVGMHLSVSTINSFAAQWLMPRLQTFQNQHPEVTLRIETSLTPVDLAERNLDSAIRRGPGQWKGLTSDYLFRDVLFPVATVDWGTGSSRRNRSPFSSSPVSGVNLQVPKQIDSGGVKLRVSQFVTGFSMF